MIYRFHVLGTGLFNSCLKLDYRMPDSCFKGKKPHFQMSLADHYVFLDIDQFKRVDFDELRMFDTYIYMSPSKTDKLRFMTVRDNYPHTKKNKHMNRNSLAVKIFDKSDNRLSYIEYMMEG